MFKHPAKVCMTYYQHCKFSLQISKLFAEASIKAVIHAFIPDWYITSTTDITNKIQKMLQEAGCRNID